MPKRFEIPFFTISPTIIETSPVSVPADLRALRPPISKIIEEQTVRDIQEMEDSLFFELAVEPELHFVEPADTFTF